MFLNQITEILSRSVPQMFCCCYHRQICEQINCTIYYISKLLAELGLSNSKSKTNSKATHSIKQIIPPNISYCLKFDINVTELGQSLQIMYWLPKICRTPVGARFIVASNYCSNNPLSDTISKNFKMIFDAVESFHKKGFFYLGCKKF